MNKLTIPKEKNKFPPEASFLAVYIKVIVEGKPVAFLACR